MSDYYNDIHEGTEYNILLTKYDNLLIKHNFLIKFYTKLAEHAHQTGFVTILAHNTESFKTCDNALCIDMVKALELVKE